MFGVGIEPNDSVASQSDLELVPDEMVNNHTEIDSTRTRMSLQKGSEYYYYLTPLYIDFCKLIYAYKKKLKEKSYIRRYNYKREEREREKENIF